MKQTTDPIAKLVHELSRLPGVGNKSAQRLAYFLLRRRDDYPARLASAILEAKEAVKPCARCGNLTESEFCEICADERRTGGILCVVEQTEDLLAIESTGEFKGRYHILEGAISPLEGIGAGDLKIDELLLRVDEEAIEEMLIATNPTIDGEATALYLQKLFDDKPIRLTRLSLGLPFNADLEYIDKETIARAILGRKAM